MSDVETSEVFSYAHVSAVVVCVHVMGVDVEGHEADASEGGRVDDGHVVGGVDAEGGDVGTSAGAHVGNTILQHTQGHSKVTGIVSSESTSLPNWHLD